MIARVKEVSRNGVKEIQGAGYLRSIDGDRVTHYTISLDVPTTPGTVRWIWPTLIPAGPEPRIEYKVRRITGKTDVTVEFSSLNEEYEFLPTYDTGSQFQFGVDYVGDVKIPNKRLVRPEVQLLIHENSDILYFYEIELHDMKPEQHAQVISFGW